MGDFSDKLFATYEDKTIRNIPNYNDVVNKLRAAINNSDIANSSVPKASDLTDVEKIIEILIEAETFCIVLKSFLPEVKKQLTIIANVLYPNILFEDSLLFYNVDGVICYKNLCICIVTWINEWMRFDMSSFNTLICNNDINTMLDNCIGLTNDPANITMGNCILIENVVDTVFAKLRHRIYTTTEKLINNLHYSFIQHTNHEIDINFENALKNTMVAFYTATNWGTIDAVKFIDQKVSIDLKSHVENVFPNHIASFVSSNLCKLPYKNQVFTVESSVNNNPTCALSAYISNNGYDADTLGILDSAYNLIFIQYINILPYVIVDMHAKKRTYIDIADILKKLMIKDVVNDTNITEEQLILTQIKKSFKVLVQLGGIFKTNAKMLALKALIKILNNGTPRLTDAIEYVVNNNIIMGTSIANIKMELDKIHNQLAIMIKSPDSKLNITDEQKEAFIKDLKKVQDSLIIDEPKQKKMFNFEEQIPDEFDDDQLLSTLRSEVQQYKNQSTIGYYNFKSQNEGGLHALLATII